MIPDLDDEMNQEYSGMEDFDDEKKLMTLGQVVLLAGFLQRKC
jgi:hypothetical protein